MIDSTSSGRSNATRRFSGNAGLHRLCAQAEGVPVRETVARLVVLLMALCCVVPGLGADWQAFSWSMVAPGVWKAEVGTPERVDLLNAAGAEPRTGALETMGAAAFPIDAVATRFIEINGRMSLRFTLGLEEEIYGLGLDFNRVRQTGTIQTLHVDHWGGTSGRTHAPVPFYVSNRGYGVFVNSARYLKVYVGTGLRTDSAAPPPVLDRNRDRNWDPNPRGDSVEVLVPAAGAEIYVFAGPTALESVRRFNLFCGGGCLPPKWGLGFTHRTPTLYTDEQLKAEVDEFERRGFPLDFVGLEPGWQSGSYPCTFEWDKDRFPDPARFVSEMKERRIRLNLWMNPYVAPASSLYAKLKPWSGSHEVWNGLVPDYLLPEPKAIFSEHLDRELVSIGVSGFKIDEVDGFDSWLWPDVATFPSGVDSEQMRQVYGVLMQRMTTELFRKRNERTYGLVRASNGGAVRFPYVIYNDHYSHQDFITALCNSSFSGLLWTPEVRGSGSGEEWLRRMQSVCFSPMAMLNAWSSGTKPWSFAEVEAEVHAVTSLRMRLLPYLYTTFAQYHFEGAPPVRAMPLVDGYGLFGDVGGAQPGELGAAHRAALRADPKDQFMLGDSLLVAPMFAGQTERQVVLPQGRWYSFYTGEFVGAGDVVTVRPGLETIPVLVRDGGIVPLIPARTHAPKAGEILPLEIRHYGRAEGDFDLYDDDGETWDYERGEFSWTRFEVRRNNAGGLTGQMTSAPAGKPFQYTNVSWRFMTPP